MNLTDVDQAIRDIIHGSFEPADRDVLSDHVMPYIYTILMSTTCGVFSIFGIVTNNINIAVFLRQGFQETINISLFALAISDLCSLVALLFVSICYHPFFMYSTLPVITEDLHLFVGGWTHIVFTRITGLITVYITFERCLCIAFPLKVKDMLNSKRVKIIIVGIYSIVLAPCIPNYFGSYLGWKFVPSLNRTMIGNIPTKHSDALFVYSLATQPFYPIFSFTSVVVCTYILISKLNQRSKWRQTASSGQNENKAMVRDRQVVKLVLCVAIMFIVSYIPSLSLFITMLCSPHYNLNKKFENSFILFCSVSFAFGGFNSAMNIFVYYKTSSNYKLHFKSLFHIQKR